MTGDNDFGFPEGGEPILLTPGPLTVSHGVKAAMLRDWGSWDSDFGRLNAEVQSRILALLGPGFEDCDVVLNQGSGTFAVEAALRSFIPRKARTLLLINGAYGRRAALILESAGRCAHRWDVGDLRPIRGRDVRDALARHPDADHLFVVHCETGAGVLNPLDEIAAAIRREGDRPLIVDAVSAFGALPIDAATRFKAIVGAPNKCLEGVPGFGFAIAAQDAFREAEGNAESLSFDLHAQYEAMQKTGRWRFTPPTHAVAALHEALKRHEEEGGVPMRGKRYAANRDALLKGMREIGLRPLIAADPWISPIIVAFFAPRDPAFRFEAFYEGLKRRRFIIYPGKQTDIDSFRIGCIGRLNPDLMRRLVAAVAETLDDMGVRDRNPAEADAEAARQAVAEAGPP